MILFTILLKYLNKFIQSSGSGKKSTHRLAKQLINNNFCFFSSFLLSKIESIVYKYLNSEEIETDHSVEVILIKVLISNFHLKSNVIQYLNHSELLSRVFKSIESISKIKKNYEKHITLHLSIISVILQNFESIQLNGVITSPFFMINLLFFMINLLFFRKTCCF